MQPRRHHGATAPHDASITFSVRTWYATISTVFFMTIVDNKKAFFDYFIEDRFEAGLVLEGWEAKAIRAGRVQLKEGYVVLQQGAFYLIGSHISPLTSASTHVNADPVRTRKLLLNHEEINKLIGKVEQRGYTIVPLNMHYQKGRIKLEIGLAKGKKQHDKRETEKERDWQREKQQIMKKRV
jgi:SsrA-binding protein